MKALILIIFLTLLSLPIIVISGCGTYVDDDLYVTGAITGEVFAIPYADKDIKIKAYKLPDISNVQSERSIDAITYRYSFWFVEEYNLPLNRAGQKMSFHYLIVPTVETHVYIPASWEVTFIPSSRIASFEGDYTDDTVLRGYDFNTIVSTAE